MNGNDDDDKDEDLVLNASLDSRDGTKPKGGDAQEEPELLDESGHDDKGDETHAGGESEFYDYSDSEEGEDMVTKCKRQLERMRREHFSE